MEAHNRSEKLAASPQLFESEFLNFFSRVHPAIPALIFIPVIVVMEWLGADRGLAAWTLVLLTIAGLGIWTLTEYWLHRLFFHLPVRGPISRTIYFFVHGVHHDWPWDRSRLVLPPSVSILLAGAFYFLFRGLFAPTYHALFAGFVLGYVIYDTVHWYTHAGAPKTRYLRFLRKQHMVHHFKQPGTRFGVSCPWWDVVFRTTGEAADAD